MLLIPSWIKPSHDIDSTPRPWNIAVEHSRRMFLCKSIGYRTFNGLSSTIFGPPRPPRQVFSVIFRYDLTMPRPPHLPDQAITGLIAELKARQPALTGTELRKELRRRHGNPGGVARIYRLLHSADTPATTPSPTASPATSTGDLQAALDAALERAQLAEHREEHHQARWAGEIHQLREQARTYKEAALRLPILEREVQDRARELAAAYKRIADLEAQLRAAER